MFGMLGDPKKKRGGKKDDVVVVAADEIHSKLSGEEARRCRNLFKTFDQEGQVRRRACLCFF
jgi:hypothetical protein